MSSAQGGQGIHFTSDALIQDPSLDPNTPEVLMYEVRTDGSLRLLGVEYLVFEQAWQYNPLGLFATWNPLVQCVAESMAEHEP